jgi:hypothetical protein
MDPLWCWLVQRRQGRLHQRLLNKVMHTLLLRGFMVLLVVPDTEGTQQAVQQQMSGSQQELQQHPQSVSRLKMRLKNF